MDLSKAFDCLPHGLLVAKLNAYGLSHQACSLIANYLSDRKQRVKIANVRSSWTSLTKGVPQGSILGPLLFNVFINDLFYCMEKCTLYNYADDNSLMNISRNVDDVISNLRLDCTNANNWFHMNGMSSNLTKFQCMLSSSTDLEPVFFEIDSDTKIKFEENVTVLGIHIDNKLTFSNHVRVCCKKAARQLNAFSRISRHLSITSRMAIFRSFILSNFQYCPLVWHFCGKQNNEKMEHIQERALRIVYNDHVSNYPELLSRAGIDTLFISRLKKVLLEVFKTVHDINKSATNTMFSVKYLPYTIRDPYPVEQTRRNTTTFGLRSVTYIRDKLWNELPLPMKQTTDHLEYSNRA